MKKMNWKKSLTLTASAALALSLLAGCGAQPAEQASSENGAVGTVLLSVNPEIEVDYDKNGLVLEIEGLNEDGKTVIQDVKDYQGKDCRTVVNDLVREIYDDGYFEGTVDGHAKNIVLKLEEGSVYVSDEFLQEVADGVRETVQECGIGAKTMAVSEGDLDDAGHIGQNKAKELVLAQLGLESASFRDHEYELDDGVYEFEFTSGGVEYEYEVDARTGKVLEADIDGNDDWDDRDDWDDQNEFDLPDDDRDDTEDDDRDDRDELDDIDDFDDQNDDLDDHDDLDDSDDSDDDNNDVDDRDDLDDKTDRDDDNGSTASAPVSDDQDARDDQNDDNDTDDLDDRADDENDDSDDDSDDDQDD